MNWSSTGAKEVFLSFDPELRYRDARTIAKELNLLQENDLSALEAIVDTVLADPSTKQAQSDFKAGQEKVIGFLVGQAMKFQRQSQPSCRPANFAPKISLITETTLEIC